MVPYIKFFEHITAYEDFIGGRGRGTTVFIGEFV